MKRRTFLKLGMTALVMPLTPLEWLSLPGKKIQSPAIPNLRETTKSEVLRQFSATDVRAAHEELARIFQRKLDLLHKNTLQTAAERMISLIS